jgi:hypothetical protein
MGKLFFGIKKIVEESLDIKGKLSSPGGFIKRFKEENGQLILNWYFKPMCTPRNLTLRN